MSTQHLVEGRRHSCGYLETAPGHLGGCLGRWPAPAVTFTAPLPSPNADAALGPQAPADGDLSALTRTAEDRARIRAWAKDRGIKVAERGGIAAKVVARYAASLEAV
jgi:hypothetical protein